ncbi:MAG: hypothetical protein AUK34_11195 [Ignavibacteria bacterium CG2_30_36_16]|nr:response regulator [Ignavibacteria bacterium]OIP56499.1 MAG: hypothetical protein AUK34_11195 [Ignavibacteria bacterium CG2_30_36_16]PJA99064.1 MAG: hypothetical protein CO127_11335 [Ignavibacteria bacterium CG_4_9_14_3_um_filter_36_18]
MKILIVDDNRNIRKMIRSLFNAKTDQFHECEDGNTSLEACAVFHPDLVLMDIKMNHMDGITATRLIKKTHPEIKIIIVTNYPHEDLWEESLKAGAETLIAKENLYLLPEIIKGVVSNI